MPTTYAGNGTVPSATNPWTRKAVVAVNNTTPIDVNVVAHGFNTGDTVLVQGTGVAAANILAQITKVNADHFLLNGTTASGSATGGGYALDMQVQPAIVLPAATEAVSAATSNPPVEAAANVVPYLYMRCGKYALYDVYAISGQGAAVASRPYQTNPWSINAAVTSSTYSAPDPTHNSTALTFASMSDTPSVPPVFSPFDLLIITMSLTAYAGTSGTVGFIGIGFGFTIGGSLISPNPTALQVIAAQPTSTMYPISLSCESVIPNNVSFPTSSFGLSLLMATEGTGSGTMSLDLVGPWTGSVLHYRSNA